MAAPKTVKSLLASVAGQISLHSPQGIWMQRSSKNLITFLSGSYEGDDVPNREILVGHGFRPKSVFIFSPLAIGIKIDVMPGALSFVGNGMTDAIELTDTGFRIIPAATATLNNAGSTFYYQVQR